MKKILIPLLGVTAVAFAQLTPAAGCYTPPPADDSSDTSTISGGDITEGVLDNFGEDNDIGRPSAVSRICTGDTLRAYTLSGKPTNTTSSGHSSIYIYRGAKRIKK